MIPYPHIDPVALALGPLRIHWYGLMYVCGFFAAWGLGHYRAKHSRGHWTSQQVSDLLCYTMLGGIVGGRLGYVLVYNFNHWMSDPLSVFRLWEGGMSIHGGIVGAGLVLLWYSRKIKRPFFELTDFTAPLLPPGLFFGRIGNFINGELWGRTTDVPWAMVFPHAGPLPRHPSQLYEALLEGILLFIIMWWYSSKPRPRMAVSGLLLLGYGIFRTLGELFREPDVQLGFLFQDETMGQLLSLPMILLGSFLLWRAYKKS